MNRFKKLVGGGDKSASQGTNAAATSAVAPSPSTGTSSDNVLLNASTDGSSSDNTGDSGNESTAVNELDTALTQKEKPIAKLHERLDKLSKSMLSENETERASASTLVSLFNDNMFGPTVVTSGKALSAFQNELCDLRETLAATLKEEVSSELNALIKNESKQFMQWRSFN